MVNPYTTHVSTKKTNQRERTVGRTDEVKNNAGGFVFEVSPWERLDRFLILGSEGGTYYCSEKKHTKDNANHVLKLIKEDGPRVVRAASSVSQSGRAPKNAPAVFCLALCASFGDTQTKKLALSELSNVCRFSTDMFTFVEMVNDLRGWGRGLRSGVAEWYDGKNAPQLAYQVTKYQQRNGWSHRDVLRLAHPSNQQDAHQLVYKYITSGKLPNHERIVNTDNYSVTLAYLDAVEAANKALTSKEIINLIQEFGLVREHIPTHFLNDVGVWNALLQKMPLTAMIRNLGKMSSIELIKPLSEASKLIVSRLYDQEYLHSSRIHPMSVLIALKTYASGRGLRGKLHWSANTDIVDALDAAFYKSFANVESTGKRWMLGLDVSGSMSAPIANTPLDCRTAAAAMALVTQNAEENTFMAAFSSRGWGLNQSQRSWMASGIEQVNISSRMRLDSVIRELQKIPMGGTDCSLPMLYALEKKIPVDVFAVYTDNETWAGYIKPYQAIKKYRREMGIDAKLIVVGMTSTGFTIADPKDSGMLDVVGFDTTAPSVMCDFAKSSSESKRRKILSTTKEKPTATTEVNFRVLKGRQQEEVGIVSAAVGMKTNKGCVEKVNVKSVVIDGKRIKSTATLFVTQSEAKKFGFGQ